MVNYKFQPTTKLCPICLKKLNGEPHNECFPNGKIILKKEDYVLIKVSNNESIIKRVLKISNSKKDNSKEFIFLYVNRKFVGYKGRNKARFITDFSQEDYKEILEDYTPREERRKLKTNHIFSTY